MSTVGAGPAVAVPSGRSAGSAVRVTLAVDAEAEEKKFAAAAATDNKPAPVKVMPSGATLLRAFLPKEEGGSEGTILVALPEIRGFVLPGPNAQRQPMQRQGAYQIELVPWYYLWAEFRDQRVFHQCRPGAAGASVFAEPFNKSVEPKSAHDSMLRGDYKAAIPMLTEERDLRKAQLDEFKSKVPTDPAQLAQRIRAWVGQAKQPPPRKTARSKGDPEALEAARMNVENVWNNEGGKLIATLLYGGVAGPAIRRQPIAWLFASTNWRNWPTAAKCLGQGHDGTRAEREWNEAVYWWRQLDKDEYKDVPEREAAQRCIVGHGDARQTGRSHPGMAKRGRSATPAGNGRVSVSCFASEVNSCFVMGVVYVSRNVNNAHPAFKITTSACPSRKRRGLALPLLRPLHHIRFVSQAPRRTCSMLVARKPGVDGFHLAAQRIPISPPCSSSTGHFTPRA